MTVPKGTDWSKTFAGVQDGMPEIIARGGATTAATIQHIPIEEKPDRAP
jgi:hypothetical protein